MAVSRLQQQLCGDLNSRLATSLNRCAVVVLRQAASARSHVHTSRQCLLSGVSIGQHRLSKHKASGPRFQQVWGWSDSPDTSSPNDAKLTAAIRACTDANQLLDLYRRRGPEFTAAQAYLALNRLVDVTTSPSSGDPVSSENATPESRRTQDDSGSPKQSPLLTGRLRVQQGQDVAQPPLHADRDWGQDAERRESNYLASTSEPTMSPSGDVVPQKLRSKRVALQEPVAESQMQRQQDQQGFSITSQGNLSVDSVGPRTTGEIPAMSPLSQPPKHAVLSMVSGLVAILSHGCQELNGRGVAETARALSRLRYHNSPLLGRLEHRALKLLKQVPRSRVDHAEQGTPSTGKKLRRRIRSRSKGDGKDGNSNDRPTANVDGMLGSHRELQLESDTLSAAQQRQQERPQYAAERVRRGGMDGDDTYTMIAAFGAMGHRPSTAWRTAIVRATEPLLATYAASPRGRLPLLISYVGAFGAEPSQSWLRTACAVLRPRLAECPPAQLRALLSGLAAMKHNPGGSWMEDYLAASERQLGNYSPWELVSTVVSLASLRCSPGESWLGKFYVRTAALVGTSGGLTGRLAAIMLASISQLKCKPDGEWLTLLLLGTRRSLGDATAEELTDILAALARLRFRPPEAWLQQYYTASFQRLPFQTPEHCCATAVALSVLGRRPQALWLEELARHMGSKLALMPAGHQSSALAALVDLGYVPPVAWLEAYEKQSNGKLAENSAEELCQTLSALAKVGFRPQGSWLYAFIMAAYSKLDSFDSTQLSLIFDCLPGLTPHGSWLDEIIQICAAEAAMRAMRDPQTTPQQVDVREVKDEPQILQLQVALQQQDLVLEGLPVVPAEVAAVPVLASASALELVPVPAVATDAVAELSNSEVNISQQLSIGLLVADAPALVAPTFQLPVEEAVSSSSGTLSAVLNYLEQGAQASHERCNVAATEDVGKDCVPSELDGTISISSELIPAAGSVLSVGAPCGPLLNGSAKADIRLGLLGDGKNVVSDLGVANGVSHGASSAPIQRMPEAERLLLDPSTATAATLVVTTIASRSAQGNGNEDSSDNGGGSTSTSNGNRSRVTSRSYGRGDGPGGGDDGGAPGGRSGGRLKEDSSSDIADLSPGINNGNDGSSGGRTPDVGLLQRPRVARAPATAVLAASSSTTPLSAADARLSASVAVEPALAVATAVAAVSQPADTVGLSRGESRLGTSEGCGLDVQPGAASDVGAEVVMLKPKPRPLNGSPQGSAVGSVPAAAIPVTASALTEMSGAGIAKAMAGGTDNRTAKASEPLLPFGSGEPDVNFGVRAAVPTSSLIVAAATSFGEVGAIAAASTTLVNCGCVQYLDSASLSRLMGTPDGPPGPDFSSCQKRAKVGRAARGGSGSGPFQLGRIWTNERKEGGNSGGGLPLTGACPVAVRLKAAPLDCFG